MSFLDQILRFQLLKRPPSLVPVDSSSTAHRKLSITLLLPRGKVLNWFFSPWPTNRYVHPLVVLLGFVWCWMVIGAIPQRAPASSGGYYPCCRQLNCLSYLNRQQLLWLVVFRPAGTKQLLFQIEKVKAKPNPQFCRKEMHRHSEVNLRTLATTKLCHTLF